MPARDSLYEQIALRLRQRFLLLDVDWILELVDGDAIDEAIDQALQIERAAHERGERPSDAERDRYRFWTDVLQLELADARRASVTFNSLDDHARQVFFALIIEERSIEECVDAGMGEHEALGRTVRSVFEKLMLPRHTSPHATVVQNSSRRLVCIANAAPVGMSPVHSPSGGPSS